VSGGAAPEKGEVILVRDRQPRASIIVASEPSDKVLTAARDLQNYIYEMSGATLPIRTDDGTWSGTLLLVGPSRYVEQLGIQVPSGYPGNEKVIVKTVGRSIVLLGNDEGAFTGSQFAVQMLLEELGWGWFGPDPLWQVVPEQKTIKLPSLDIEHTPSFALRSVWNGMGQRWYLGDMPLQCAHAHSRLFPPSEYYQEHPDFYPIIGGKRWNQETGGDWQLCTSNSEVIRLTIEKARRFFDEDPQQVMFSLSNNDCGGFCECEACAATGSNPGARMLAFANAVARGLCQTHPESYVIFLAYWFTHEAPREEKMQWS